ncbi:MAG: sugar ABC transporter substrate-binding protein [Bacillota bacterium]|nr:sugar ABC transporter substrate-binding protein [Bacillota bacterium]
MLSKKRTLLVVLVVTLLVGALAGTTFAQDYRISVVLKALNSDYWKTVEAGANAAAEEFGVEISVVGPSAETQVQEQFDMLQDQLTREIDALVVAPLRPTATVAVFEQAKALGIPVFLIDTDADWDDKATFIGTGNYDAGAMAGKYFMEKMPEGGDVVIIRGAMGDLTHDERVNGFVDAVKGSNINVVRIQAADSERGKGMDVMQNMLMALPNIKGVYCSNDEMALGALRAVEMAGAEGIIIMGFDGSPDALKSVRDGGLTGTVKQDSYGIGYYGIEYAVKLLNGEQIDKRIPVPTLIVDIDNVQENIAEMEKIVGRTL